MNRIETVSDADMRKEISVYLEANPQGKLAASCELMLQSLEALQNSGLKYAEKIMERNFAEETMNEEPDPERKRMFGRMIATAIEPEIVEMEETEKAKSKFYDAVRKANQAPKETASKPSSFFGKLFSKDSREAR